MSERRGKKRQMPQGIGSMLDKLRHKKDESPKMMTVREEKKTLVRVVKAKPKAVKHRSDALQRTTVSDEEMKVTEEVVQRATSAPGGSQNRPSKGRGPPRQKTFECPECGAHIPENIEMCPICHVKYLRDICPEALAELDKAMSEATRSYGDLIEIKDLDSMPVLHFDTVDGLMNYLEQDDEESEFMLECPQCSAVVQLDEERCPVCGTTLEPSDVGILSLLRGLDFNSEDLSELECPQCGEHVTLENGVCPVCEAMICDPEGSGDDKKLVPVIGNDNVVFIHMDLEKGDLNFIQKHLGKITPDHVSIQLDKISSSDFDHEWKGLSRI